MPTYRSHESTAGVDESIWKFSGPARVYESPEDAMEGVLEDVQSGEVVVFRYEGPKGGPGMHEMLYPTTYIKSRGLRRECALLTDGRFSGGTSGLSVGRCFPEPADGGLIGLVEDGDLITFDIPHRSIVLDVDDETLAARRAAQEQRGPAAFTPVDRGAVRDVSQLRR